MHRRTFAQLLALGAGTGTLARCKPRRNKTTPPKAASQTPLLKTPRAAPVCVADFQALAQARLPAATYEYITTGSADGHTLRENSSAFQRLGLLPPLLHGVSAVDLSTKVLGQKITTPIMLAPVAAQRMYHPQGGLAAARAAAEVGTVFGVSSSIGNSVEEVAAAGKGPKWFQLYVPSDRAVCRRLVNRVERAGFKAIILTVDLGEWKDADRRNRFMLPKEMLVKHLRDIGYEQVSDKMSYEEVVDFNLKAWDLSLKWEFFDWLRGQTKLPLLIKGVLRPEDATKAVEIGLDGIVVSNHGGRRLDGMPATIDVLPGIVEAVGGRAEVFLDGGVRRGTDVLKALSLGARAVLIGRPYAWALAAEGQAGVSKVLHLLSDELRNAMVATGCARTADAHEALVIPAGG